MGNGYKPDAHEFTISPRSTALAIAYRPVLWNTKRFGGSKHGKVFDNVVQEIDIATGAVLYEWHSLGNVSLGASVSKPPGDGGAWDWFHLNSIEDDGNSFLISARKVSSLYRIDRLTARVRWRLRGDGIKPTENDFTMEPGTSFGYQHDARRLPNGDISLFDNGRAKRFRPVNNQSSVLILRLEKRGDSAGATLVKRIEKQPEPVLATSQGGAQVLRDGNVFVGWGSISRMTEFTPDGSIAFDAVFRAPTNSYRAQKADWEGIAPGRPVIASRKNSRKGKNEDKGMGATVWASWNGAGDIAYWQVMSGSAPGKLREVARAPWAGLETRIRVPMLGKRLKVIARGADLEALGSSTLVGVSERSTLTAVADLDLPELDLSDPELKGERWHETMNGLLAEGHWLARGPLATVILDREAGEHFLRSRSAIFPGLLLAEMFQVSDGPLFEQMSSNIINADGDTHRRLRGLVNPSLSPRAAKRYRPFMRQILDQVWDEAVEGLRPAGRAGEGTAEGTIEMDFMEAFARPYPARTIARVMGAPAEDAPRLHDWSMWIQRQFDPIALADAGHGGDHAGEGRRVLRLGAAVDREPPRHPFRRPDLEPDPHRRGRRAALQPRSSRT